MTDSLLLPYRRNVGAMVFNRQGKLFVARRIDMPGAGGSLDEGVWQCPQGGIDANETPQEAVLRELREETGILSANIIGEYPDWLNYDFPKDMQNSSLKDHYRGQSQKWFALRFVNNDDEIDLTRNNHAEFDAWQWIILESLPKRNVGFRRKIYSILCCYFANLAIPI